MVTDLKSITDVIGDGLHGTPVYDDDGQFFFINGNNLNETIEIKPDTKRVNEAEYYKYKKPLNSNTILLSINGTLGNFARYNDEPVILGKSACYINIKQGYNVDYISWFLKSKVKSDFERNATGTTIKNISLKQIREFQINLPDDVGQEKIAKTLNSIQAKIDINNKINRNLLQQVGAIYDHLVEQNWSTSTILDIAEKVAMGPFGSNIKVSTFVPEGVPIISGNHLRGYFLEEPEFNYITEEHAKRLKNSIVYPHDLIFTHAGNIGQVAMIPDGCKYDRYVLSQRQFYLRCNETKIVPEFILLFFHSSVGQHELLSYANQTGVPSIAQPVSNLKKIPFKCPPIAEQRLWQNQVNPLLGRYLNNRHENERLSELRDTLLPKLMSGELDVSNINI